MLDLLPQPEAFRIVDVRLGDDVFRNGRLYRRSFFVGDIRAARDGLERAVSDGMFQKDEEVAFDSIEHYDSVESWKTCLGGDRVEKLEADEPLLEKACELMPEGRGEIIVTEGERAARFTRLG